MVYVFLADGFEEIEALTPVDLLRRAGVEVQTVSIVENRRIVTGARKIVVNADITIEEVDYNKAELLVLPGGMPGTTNLAQCEKLMVKVDEFAKTGDVSKRLAAICAAPSVILGKRDLLVGKRATCYPGMEDGMHGAIAVTDKVVTDGNITTSRGMGTAADFAIELISLLCGKDKAIEIKNSVVMS